MLLPGRETPCTVADTLSLYSYELLLQYLVSLGLYEEWQNTAGMKAASSYVLSLSSPQTTRSKPLPNDHRPPSPRVADTARVDSPQPSVAPATAMFCFSGPSRFPRHAPGEINPPRVVHVGAHRAHDPPRVRCLPPYLSCPGRGASSGTGGTEKESSTESDPRDGLEGRPWRGREGSPDDERLLQSH
jgi:hypothetical protein